MLVLYLVKTSDASERIQRRRPLLVEPECRTFFKSLFKLLTLQPLSENLRINLLAPKTWNLYKFSVKMRTSAAPDCCMTRSGLHQRVIGEAIDHVAWTAAHLCENWWTRLQTLAGIIWTLLDSYLMWHFDFYVETSYLTLYTGILYTVEIVARFYTVQYKHTKRDVVLYAFVFVPNFLEYVSAKNWQNWMTSD